MSSPPIGVRILSKWGPSCGRIQRQTVYQISVLALTFLAYASYHLSRRPLSIVKTILNRNCSQVPIPLDVTVTNLTRETWCDWKPFDGEDSNSLLGFLDSCFLFSYAFCMFFSGFIAERCHLRYFLALGMIGSGIMTYLFGIAFYYNIHSIWYFAIVQIICGAFQTTGWPATVAAVGHWFGPKSSRGVIFGFWNSHTNLGNVIGAAISGVFVEYNWGLSFIVPGVIVAVVGFILFLFLVPYPEEVGLVSADADEEEASRRSSEQGIVNSNDDSAGGQSSGSPNKSPVRRKLKRVEDQSGDANDDEVAPLIDTVESGFCSKSSFEKEAISFAEALRIPGVIEYSLSLFFCKLVSYTFLYWLPMYIKDSTSSSSEKSAYLSTPFDVGGIAGAIVAGVYADRTGASALTCIVMLFFTIPSLFLFQEYGGSSVYLNIGLQLVAGALVNGPYSLITTAVSADLGNKVTSSKALATVTAIIDGTGSIGAALGPLAAGLVSNTGWNNVFYMVMMADFISMLLLLRLGKHELHKIRNSS